MAVEGKSFKHMLNRTDPPAPPPRGGVAAEAEGPIPDAAVNAELFAQLGVQQDDHEAGSDGSRTGE